MATKDQWVYIDSHGKVLIKTDFEIAGSFAQDLAPVRVKRKYGYIDRTGKLVIQPEFDSAEPFSEGLAAVLVGDPQTADKLDPWVEKKWGYINKAGGFVIQPQFQNASAFKGGIATVGLGSAGWDWGYIDTMGNKLLEVERCGAKDFSENLVPAREGKQMGFKDQTGNFVIPAMYDYVGGFSNGLAPVRIEDKMGYIDHMNKFQIQPEFEAAEVFSEGLAAVKKGEKYGFIDIQGRMVTPLLFDEVEDGFSGGVALVKMEDNWYYVDTSGKILIASHGEPESEEMKKTGENLSSWESAVKNYRNENKEYPAAQSLEQLHGLVNSTQNLPLYDGWGTKLGISSGTLPTTADAISVAFRYPISSPRLMFEILVCRGTR